MPWYHLLLIKNYLLQIRIITLGEIIGKMLEKHNLQSFTCISTYELLDKIKDSEFKLVDYFTRRDERSCRELVLTGINPFHNTNNLSKRD